MRIIQFAHGLRGLWLVTLALAACATSGDPNLADDDAGASVDAASHDSGGGASSGDAGLRFDAAGADAVADSASAMDAARDASTSDSGTSDAGVDTGAADTGAADTGVADTGAADTGVADTGAADTGVADTGPHDGGCVGHGYSGVLATYNLSAQAGNEASAAATSSATGITAGALTRAAALTAVTGSGSINASGWGTGASADATRYYTFSIQPAAGCTVSLSSLALDVKASATGPSTGDVATSVDSFGAHVGAFAGTSTPTVTFTGVSASGAIEVRIYGFGATGAGGTFRIQSTMTVSGTLD